MYPWSAEQKLKTPGTPRYVFGDGAVNNSSPSSSRETPNQKTKRPFGPGARSSPSSVPRPTPQPSPKAPPKQSFNPPSPFPTITIPDKPETNVQGLNLQDREPSPTTPIVDLLTSNWANPENYSTASSRTSNHAFTPRRTKLETKRRDYSLWRKPVYPAFKNVNPFQLANLRRRRRRFTSACLTVALTFIWLLTLGIGVGIYIGSIIYGSDNDCSPTQAPTTSTATVMLN